MKLKPDDQYSEPEAQRRFLGTLKAAINTAPKPLKNMPPKGVSAQRKAMASKAVQAREAADLLRSIKRIVNFPLPYIPASSSPIAVSQVQIRPNNDQTRQDQLGEMSRRRAYAAIQRLYAQHHRGF